MCEYVVVIGITKTYAPSDLVDTRTVVKVKSRELAGEIARELYTGSMEIIEKLKAEGLVVE